MVLISVWGIPNAVESADRDDVRTCGVSGVVAGMVGPGVAVVVGLETNFALVLVKLVSMWGLAGWITLID